MSVVAEGVEDSQTLAQLADHGCDLAQGYCVGRPGPVAALDVWLADRTGRSGPVGPTAALETTETASISG
ncbi:EAL domain-containing protein [Arthrobacter sp. CG_A4]|uniref:EAL domain-containing protein n=1 Tax=Arthrobacter sp. CG_A4 TaxID=3071706 RepID=UPI002E018E3C|nr:EAL domain-containing protein (putative c-di-GMP-specific phosphodiesterase class I) [Arthrobacter sp. CG_A4]